jgi:hypothetical protein
MAVITGSLLTAPYLSFALPKMDGNPGSCKDTGKRSGEGGLMVNKCCWSEQVKPGTGAGGGDKVFYCQECEDGGTRGYINCTDPEQDRDKGRSLPPMSGNLNNGQISDDPVISNNGNSIPNSIPKGGLDGGFEQLQTNNNIIQSTTTPDPGKDKNNIPTTEDQTENQTESLSSIKERLIASSIV